MKLTNVVIENEDGENAEIARADYIKHAVKAYEVSDFESEEHGNTPANKVVGHILKSYEDDKDVSEVVQSEYSDLCDSIREDYDRTVEAKKNKKAKAEEEKQRKKEEKEKREKEEAEKKAAQLKTQEEFVVGVGAGAELAAEEFKGELESLAGSLPDGVTVDRKGTGFGLTFAEDATKETVSNTLGYLMQKQANSSFVANQIQFWIGDTISYTVEKNIFPSAKEAGKFISEFLSKNGKNIQASSLNQYKLMAERTPVEYRNPQVDPSAYLAVSNMSVPKKGDSEKDADYKKRLEAFKKDQEALQLKLSNGEILKRKEIMPEVDTVLKKHGLREDNPEPTISVGENLLVFFHATVALSEFLGVHEEDVIIYQEGDNKITVTKEEMEEKLAEARGNLLNILYTDKKKKVGPADYIRGHKIEEKEVEVGKDQNKKPIIEKKKEKIDVFPAPFFEIPKEEEDNKEPAKEEE